MTFKIEALHCLLPENHLFVTLNDRKVKLVNRNINSTYSVVTSRISCGIWPEHIAICVKSQKMQMRRNLMLLLVRRHFEMRVGIFQQYIGIRRVLNLERYFI